MWEVGGLPKLGKIGAVGLFVPIQGGHFSKDAKNLPQHFNSCDLCFGITYGTNQLEGEATPYLHW